MGHLSWLVGQIDTLAGMDAAHSRSVVRDLVGALAALDGRGATVFGMSAGSLDISDDERNEAMLRIRKALVAKRDAFQAAGDRELLRELSEVAEVCAMPELHSSPVMKHPAAPWLREAESGIAVLGRCNQADFEDVIACFMSIYRGPAFGGLDVMPPNEAGNAWLLIGRWKESFDDAVQPAAIAFAAALKQAVSSVNDGTTIRKNGTTTELETTNRTREIMLTPWHAYEGTVKMRGEPDYVRLPGFIGPHMGAPHWFGRGVDQSADGRIQSVTPYISLDVHDDQGTILALAAPAAFDRWLSAFLEMVT